MSSGAPQSFLNVTAFISSLFELCVGSGGQINAHLLLVFQAPYSVSLQSSSSILQAAGSLLFSSRLRADSSHHGGDLAQWGSIWDGPWAPHWHRLNCSGSEWMGTGPKWLFYLGSIIDPAGSLIRAHCLSPFFLSHMCPHTKVS